MQLGAIQPGQFTPAPTQRTGVAPISPASVRQPTSPAVSQNAATDAVEDKSGIKPETIFSGDSVKKWLPWAIAAFAVFIILNNNTNNRR